MIREQREYLERAVELGRMFLPREAGSVTQWASVRHLGWIDIATAGESYYALTPAGRAALKEIHNKENKDE